MYSVDSGLINEENVNKIFEYPFHHDEKEFQYTEHSFNVHSNAKKEEQ
jgi:hypothetical protein